MEIIIYYYLLVEQIDWENRQENWWKKKEIANAKSNSENEKNR